MKTFNSSKFIKALKESYDAIPVLQGDGAAKVLVADSIKSNGYNPEDVFSYIYSQVAPTSTLSDADWKKVVETAIKNGGALGKNLEVYKTALKGKLNNEAMFNLAASCCGVNPVLLRQELCLNQISWTRVLETLIKTSGASKEVEKEESVMEKPVAVKKAKKVEKKASSIKTTKLDPRSKSITLVNVKTGKVKTWSSYRACEKELYGDGNKGRGVVSQLLNPKKGLKNLRGGWTLPKVENNQVAAHKLSAKRAVSQMKRDKRGNLKVVKTYASITEAAKATGIPHSSISKSTTGTYQTAGGYVWKAAEAAA